VRLQVKLIPRASRDAIAGFDDDGALRIRVTAAPVKGGANTAMLKLLAKRLSLPVTAVVLVHGAASRTKIIEIPLDEAAVHSRLQR
jgi:uncharacterized protein (TIGR00251 family)